MLGQFGRTFSNDKRQYTTYLFEVTSLVDVSVNPRHPVIPPDPPEVCFFLGMFLGPSEVFGCLGLMSSGSCMPRVADSRTKQNYVAMLLSYVANIYIPNGGIHLRQHV